MPVLAVPLLSFLLLAEPGVGEARVSIDVKDAEVADIARLLGELGGFQVVLDPDLSCRLTLKLNDARWLTALETTLRACGLSYEESGGVVRLARSRRLAEEAAERRRLGEAQRLSEPPRLARYRLSYARAARMAPLVKRLLSPRGEVVLDERTNTLFIID